MLINLKVRLNDDRFMDDILRKENLPRWQKLRAAEICPGG